MKKINLITIIIFIIFPLKLHALIEVDITRGNLNPLPIAVSALYADDITTKAIKKEIKVEKIGEEISSVIEMLASEGGAYITGQNIRVDGGITRSV